MMISVIIPVYNVEAYLECCLESIINQSYKKMEIILIDDASTDNSGEICDQYAKKDSRIIVFHNPQNMGVVYTRSIGFQYAHGDYISCVDADDWIDLDAYLHIVDKIHKHSPDAVLFGFYKEYQGCSEEMKEQLEKGLYKTNELSEYIQIDSFFYTPFITQTLWNKVFKRDLVKKHELIVPRDMNMFEDAVLTYLCLSETETICIMDNCFYHYRSRKGSAVFLENEKNYNSCVSGVKVLSEAFQKNIFSNSKTKHLFLDFIFYNLLSCSPDKLFSSYNLDGDLLFLKFREKKRIIIYGKGSIGTKLYEIIRQNPNYDLISWMDQSDKHQLVKLDKASYDFVLVAVGNARIVCHIRDSLQELEIPREKIVTFNDMNREVDVLPKEIKEILEQNL